MHLGWWQRPSNAIPRLSTFTAETDHKLLISIRKKQNLNDMSPRIQHMMMVLQRCDFELIYTPGKYIVLADASLPTSDVMLQQIVQETAKDSPLQKVSNYIQNGWSKGDCPGFCPVCADLCMANELLLRQNRIVIPQSMHQDMLQCINEGHLGMEKCKRRARGNNKHIEEMIQKCETCLKHRYKQKKSLCL